MNFIDPLCATYRGMSKETLFRRAEHAKESTYADMRRELSKKYPAANVEIVPFVMTTFGDLGPRALLFINRATAWARRRAGIERVSGDALYRLTRRLSVIAMHGVQHLVDAGIRALPPLRRLAHRALAGRGRRGGTWRGRGRGGRWRGRGRGPRREQPQAQPDG